MRRIKKLFILPLLAGITISLASCDWDFTKLLDSGTNDQAKDGNGKSNSDSEGINSTGGQNKEIEYIPKIDEEELEIVDLALDYENSYGYKKLCEDPEHGNDFKTLYKMFYDQSMDILVSSNDFETSEINTNTGIIYGVKFNQIQYDDLSLFPSGLTYEMANSVALEFIYDNPLFYYLHQGLGRAGNYVYLLGYKEYKLASERSEMNLDIIHEISEFKKGKNFDTMSIADKAKYTNKYIIERIIYAEDSNGKPEESYWAHNIEGFTNDEYKKGICECYAKAFNLFGSSIGIESVVVTGTANSGSGVGGHAWNYVKIDDKWYGVDCTWNDPTVAPLKPNGDYFLIGKMNRHTPYNDQEYGLDYRALPTISNTNYYL